MRYQDKLIVVKLCFSPSVNPSGLRLQAFFLGCPSTSEDWPRDLLSVREAEVFLGLYVGFGAVCCGVSALIFAHSTQRVSPEGCDAAENAKFSVFAP